MTYPDSTNYLERDPEIEKLTEERANELEQVEENCQKIRICLVFANNLNSNFLRLERCQQPYHYNYCMNNHCQP